MSERWAVIREAFDKAADADAATREQVLASLDADPATRDQLSALLEAHDRRTLLDESPTLLLRAGPFVLRERIGSGGFGDVYRGEQTSPVVREAAVKVLHGTHRAREVLARFSLEQHTLARLDHPCIARLYEAGVGCLGDAAGGERPWFAMQLVRGQRIDRWATEANPLQVAALLAGVADAVHHAHQCGVIHRDIKPSNILVEPSDAGPIGRLIDFGVAKALDTDGPGGVTLEQVRVGTPAYMSPEQRDGRVVDVRTDVYALGAVLYDLIAGMVNDGAVPDRSFPLTRPGDRRVLAALEPVVRKAMADDPGDRYATASALAADLYAVCAGAPTSVGRVSLLQRVRWGVRRRPVAWGTAALITVALLGGIAGAGYGLLVAWNERDAARLAAAYADRQRAGAEAALAILEETLTGIDPEIARGRDTSLLLDRVRNALQQLDGGVLSAQPEAETRLRVITGNALLKLGRPTEAEPLLVAALATARQRFGRHHVLSHEAATAWLNCLLQVGRHAEAIAAVDEASQGAVLPGAGASKRERLAAVYERQNWANACLNVGDTERAARYNRESIDLIATIDEPGSQTQYLAFLLASEVAFAGGDLVAALAHAQRALAVAEQAYTSPHPSLARAHNDVGTCLEELGRTREALPHKQTALATARELFAPGDSRIALSMNNVSITLAKLGEEDQAREMIDGALEMFRALYPSQDNPDLARALDHCAVRHAVAGDLPQAESLASEGLAMRRRLAPAGDEDLARSLVTLARVLAVSGRLDEALPYFSEAVELQRRLAGGEDRYAIARTLAINGVLLFRAGRAAEAEPLLNESVEMGLRLYPLDKGANPEVAEWAAALADCLRKLGKTEAAEALTKRFKNGR
ncbi:MAG: serine/threonine-protein kinase [Phycisphaerales bacterium]|nr:serine/threonine-protein kinase [Phycisphaerales bacterium]